MQADSYTQTLTSMQIAIFKHMHLPSSGGGESIEQSTQTYPTSRLLNHSYQPSQDKREHYNLVMLSVNGEEEGGRDSQKGEREREERKKRKERGRKMREEDIKVIILHHIINYNSNFSHSQLRGPGLQGNQQSRYLHHMQQ